MPRRVVLDSNVLISALHRHGTPQAIVDLARTGEVDLYLSPFILDEVSGILRRKLGWDDQRIALALLALRLAASVIDPGPPRLHVLADEPDNRILECALAAQARYLVTGDRRLRALGKYRRVRILTPRAFLSLTRLPKP
jgi:putative PIN family toxin of toxin-antitoxin system